MSALWAAIISLYFSSPVCPLRLSPCSLILRQLSNFVSLSHYTFPKANVLDAFSEGVLRPVPSLRPSFLGSPLRPITFNKALVQYFPVFENKLSYAFLSFLLTAKKSTQ